MPHTMPGLLPRPVFNADNIEVRTRSAVGTCSKSSRRPRKLKARSDLKQEKQFIARYRNSSRKRGTWFPRGQRKSADIQQTPWQFERVTKSKWTSYDIHDDPEEFELDVFRVRTEQRSGQAGGDFLVWRLERSSYHCDWLVT